MRDLNVYIVQVHTGKDWETITLHMPFQAAVDMYIMFKNEGEKRPLQVIRHA